MSCSCLLHRSEGISGSSGIGARPSTLAFKTRARLQRRDQRSAARSPTGIDYFPTPYCLDLKNSGPWPNIYPIATCLYSGNKGESSGNKGESATKKAKARIKKYAAITQPGGCFDARASRVNWLPVSTPFNVASATFSARSMLGKLPKQGRVNGLSEPLPDALLLRGFFFPIHSGIFRKN